MAENTFTIFTDPHVAHVGDVDYQFIPEVETHTLLSLWAELMRKSRERKLANPTPAPTDADDEDAATLTQVERMAATSQDSTNDLREFISALMTDESKAMFAGKTYADRVLIGMQNWILEVYGLRPTSSSNGSSEPSSTTSPAGNDGTEASPSVA